MTSRGLADTSLFIAEEQERHYAVERVPDELAVSIVTVGELRAGVLTASDARVRARRLSTLEHALTLSPLPIDDSVSRVWAELRVALRDSGLRMGVNDSWIAATALAAGVPLVTQDREIPSVAGLAVLRL